MALERRIASRSNPFCRHILRLGTERAYRREQALYLCDGLTLLSEALSSSQPPVDVIAAENAVLPPLPDDLRLTLVPPALLTALSPVDHPQGVLCLCPLPAPLTAPPERGRYLYLSHIQDPGNVGSLLRSAEAFGLDGVYLDKHCANAFHPKTVRGAMGALFRLPVGEAEAENLLNGIVPLWAAAPRGGALPLGQAPMPADIIIALGNEARGLPPDIVSGAAQAVAIPMAGGAESLGVAAAGAIIAWVMSQANKGE